MNRSALFALSVFVLICAGLGVGFSAVHQRTAQAQVDSETLCPTVVTGHTLLLIDSTDPWSPAQIAGLRVEINRIARSLRAGERFSVVAIPAVLPSLPKPEFSKCSPGMGSEADPVTQGSKVLQDRFERLFMTPLDAYVGALSLLHSAPTTPLLEVLRAVSEREDFAGAQGRRRIVIASDMLQNYGGVSHYRATLGDYTTFEKSAKALELKPDLSDVEVRLLYLVRPSASSFQGSRHIRWWKAHVAASGGTVGGVEPLE